MNVIKLVSAGIIALKKGEIITHPQRWKSAQVISMALVAFAVPLYSAFCASPDACYGVGEDDVKNIATWLGGAAFALFQIWATIATTTKIGLGKKPGNRLSAGPDGLREPYGSDTPEQVPPDSRWSTRGDSRRGRDQGPFFDDYI